MEYVIVDGGSTDGSLEQAREALARSGMAGRTVVISEKDEGIYDAMNKGVRACSGDMVLFLNAGDLFAETATAEKIAEAAAAMGFAAQRAVSGEPAMGKAASGADILYGDYRDCFPDHEIAVKYTGRELSASFFLSSRMICHQAIVASVRWLKKHPFRTEYRYCADREWLMWCYRQKARISHIPVEICRYDRGGVSSDEEVLEQIREEMDRCLRVYFPVRERLLEIVKRNKGLRNWLRQQMFLKNRRKRGN